jgi:precorrin-6B methylase 2
MKIKAIKAIKAAFFLIPIFSIACQGGNPPATENLGAAGIAVQKNQEQEAPTRRPDVVFVPTPQAAVEKMLEMAEIKPDDVLFDLGCGDGRIVVTAAKKYGIRAVGIDIDPERVKESIQNVKENEVEHLVTIKHADIFETDISEANVVTLYLLPHLNVKLIPQLQELKPGSRIISYDFDMRGVEPEEVYRNRYTIYKWVTPLEVKEED